MHEIAPDVAIVPTLIANAYLAGDRSSWVLVDACTPGHEQLILRAAESRFGRGARPRAILLTHGHFDHAGSAVALADRWDVPIYAHRLEIPFLTGQAAYPPFDYSSPGFFTRIARFFPTATVNLGTRVAAFETDRSGLAGGNACPTSAADDGLAGGNACPTSAAGVRAVPGLPDWTMVETPGHTPGQVAFFRPADAVLLAGDAVTTMNLDSFFDTILRRRQVCRPPVPATSNWRDAAKSVRLLADLQPSLIAAGHGLPARDAAGELSRLAKEFPFPRVRAAAR